MTWVFSNFGQSRLDGAITDVATSLTVLDGSVFPSTGDFTLRIDDELILCTARSTNVLTVTRGQEGTTGVAHSNSAIVTHVISKAVYDTFLQTLAGFAHADLAGITTDDHHDRSHGHSGVDGSGTVSHGALTDLGDDDHTQYATNTEFDDHSARHENGGADELSLAGLDGTPTAVSDHTADTLDAHDASAISIADAGSDFTATTVEGALDEIQADNEAHVAAADPHTGYRLESADHSHASAGAQGGTIDHGVITGLTDDDHTQYLKEADFDDIDFIVGTATGHTGAEIVAGTAPGGELGGTWASPTIDATHSGSTHAAATDTHIADTSDAHDASAISIADAGNDFTATEVEGALAELQSDAEAHLADTADAHDASAISVLDAAADYTATDVEGVLAEIAPQLGGGGGAGVDLQSFTADNTWTKPANAVLVRVMLIGAGGGGGSGGVRNTGLDTSGGGGGGGGFYAERLLQASDLAATEAIVVGVGGTGGAGQTANGADGNVGGSGEASSFGDLLEAAGGNGGAAGNNAGNAAGGGGGDALGNPNFFTDWSDGTTGGTSPATGASPGAAGGSADSNSERTAPGGGAGAGKGGAANAGGAGGNAHDGVTGGAGGTNPAGTPGAGSPPATLLSFAGSGGGGSGSSAIAVNTPAGGAGGTAAGGGGSGATMNGGDSGNGGAGGNGIVVVITHVGTP